VVKAWRGKNRQRFNATRVAAQRKKSTKARTRKTAEEIRAQKQAYYRQNAEKLRQQTRERQQQNPERNRANVRAWRRKNPDKYRAALQRYRARKSHAAVCDFTAAEWREMLAAYNHRCVYCGRKMQRLSQDHITPLVTGGNHTKSNIVPACQSCNSKKGKGLPLVPVQPLLL
jgi:5-methylcytosine-specific restriction endonuclease McrA